MRLVIYQDKTKGCPASNKYFLMLKENITCKAISLNSYQPYSMQYHA